MSIIKIKNINVYYANDNRFNVFLDKLSGHGTINVFDGDTIFESTISDPTGLQPAVFYQTGILSGIINPGSGSLSWQDLTISGTGQANKVYLNYVTGYVNASNVIEFINSTGSGLQNLDILNINNFTFTFNKNATPPIEFNSPSHLIKILNSGATGGFNDQGYESLQNSLGLTGYQTDNKLFLFSYLISGEEGNNIRIYRDCQNINAIKIANRYFTGGKSFRPVLNNWTGDFINTFNLTIEKSGFYNKESDNIEIFKTIQGVAWEDNFDKNYNILTGFKDPRNPQNYSGIKLSFNQNINQYSGKAIIPINQSTVYTGLNIEIFKPNPYNISGNIAQYIISGDNFTFEDYIEG